MLHARKVAANRQYHCIRRWACNTRKVLICLATWKRAPSSACNSPATATSWLRSQGSLTGRCSATMSRTKFLTARREPTWLRNLKCTWNRWKLIRFLFYNIIYWCQIFFKTMRWEGGVQPEWCSNFSGCWSKPLPTAATSGWIVATIWVLQSAKLSLDQRRMAHARLFTRRHGGRETFARRI